MIRLLSGLSLVAIVALSGCREPAPAPSKGATQRVAVMAPAAAELMQVLGLLDRIVAVGDFVDWPPVTRELPRIGAYDAPNEEVLLALGVDVMITSYSEAAVPRLARLRELGIEVLALEMSTYEGIFDSLRRIGSFFDVEERAGSLEEEIRARLEVVREQGAGAPRRRVLLVVGRDPLFVAGPGSHLDQMITLAGGQNIAADALSSYQLVSLEAMLERSPEVIIDTSDNHANSPRGRRLGVWKQWSFLPAVQHNRVYLVNPSRLVIAGPRLPEMTELMGEMIHPEIFGEPSADELGPLR